MKRLVMILLLAGSMAARGADGKTQLIVGITVSQFYPEWLTMYGGDLSENGLKRILRDGVRVTADYNYLFSQTGVDQTTIYSGQLPSEHGIMSHQWFDRLHDRRQDNVTAGDYHAAGEKENSQGLSPSLIQTMTLGCAMKMNNSFSKIYSIGVNGEEAVLSGGNCADMAFWLSEETGKWMSSGYYADSLPAWLKKYNTRMESDFLIRRGWMPLSDENANATALKLKSKVGMNGSFFYDISQARKNFNTYRVLKATPYANTLVTDLAVELIGEGKLGKDNDPDLLALNYSSLDYMNRDFGVNAPEFRDLVMRLDREAEKLLTALDAKVGRGNYTVFLTFSEARELLPEEMEKMRVTAGYFSVFKAVALLKSYLNVLYGPGEWIRDYDAGQIYLNRALIEKQKIPIKEVQDRVADFMIDFEGVARVMTAYSMSHNVSASGVEQLFQNSFSQKRSGDVMFCLQPAWVPELKDLEDNYTRYSKRSRVPLYFFGTGVTAPDRRECRMTDLLPTLCHLLRIPVPYTAGGGSLMR